MKRAVLIAILAAAATFAWGHDVITTKITFDREVIRIVMARCASCHKPSGSAFSLVTYNEARPWAKAIQEEVLERRMPPWGAVKGFGEFRDEQALTPEQIEVIADWVEGGAPEGETKDLPPPPKPDKKAGTVSHGGGLACPACVVKLSGDFKLQKTRSLYGLKPEKVAANSTFQMIAELPDGSILPLLWLEPFKPAFSHPFWFKTPLSLPAGTVIRGVPSNAVISMSLKP